MIAIIFFWFGLSVAVGILAVRYNRSAGWFLSALVFSPLLAGVWLLAMGPKAPKPQTAAPYWLEDGRIVEDGRVVEANKSKGGLHPLAWVGLVFCGVMIWVAYSTDHNHKPAPLQTTQQHH
jgi:hypothetical protein